MTYGQGDLNYDGTINLLDYKLLTNHYNSSLSAPPAAPGQLVVSNDGTDPTGTLDVSWTAPSGTRTVSDYRLQSSTDGETFTTLADNIPATQTTFQDSGHGQGTRIWYRVHAVYTDGTVSAYTAKRALTTVIPGVYIQNVAAATLAADGKTINLSALGTDGLGESSLTYSWDNTLLPAGADTPTYSVNGTNASKNTVATITGAGDYAFEVTITDTMGLSITSDVDVTVAQIPATLAIDPTTATVAAGDGQEFDVTGLDQFNDDLDDPTLNWTVTGLDGGTVSDLGFYNAPADNSGSFTVSATSPIGGATATATAVVPLSIPELNAAATAARSI